MWATFLMIMAAKTGPERVVVVPRNGYVNWLQALASAAILAHQWGSRLDVLWEHQEVAPAGLSDLVETSRLTAGTIDPGQVTEILGANHDDMPRYLSLDPPRGTAFLAGHDRGEQAFMEELQQTVSRGPLIRTVVIVAGGKFHLPGQIDFDARRRDYYRNMPWKPSITSPVDQLSATVPSYVGLHIRETDRSRDAPTPRRVERSLRQVCEESGLGDVFIAADTSSARDSWRQRISTFGLTPHTHADVVLDRTDPRAAQVAISDWLTLGNAQGLVYSSASSFGQEAAVMCGNPGLTRGLRSTWLHRLSRDAVRVSEQGLRRLGAK